MQCSCPVGFARGSPRSEAGQALMGWGGSGLSQQGLESLTPNLVDLGTPHWLLSASNPPSPPGRSWEQELGVGAPGGWPISTWFSLWE